MVAPVTRYLSLSVGGGGSATKPYQILTQAVDNHCNFKMDNGQSDH